jgi:hypothetical protein
MTTMVSPSLVWFVEAGLASLLVASIYGIVVWRNRMNKFLFYGWSGTTAALGLLCALVLWIGLQLY